MTPTEIKQTLAGIGAGPNKRLGQHFLINKPVLATIVEEANIRSGDRVLEIGPGLGVLTHALLDAGADVTAIEKDRRFQAYLDERFANEAFTLIKGDATDVHWHEAMGDEEWKFVSNLPYGITSFALRKALWAPHPPEMLVALIQREVAERIVMRDHKMSLLSLMVALSASSARITRRVPASAFYPAPKVESAVIRISPMPWPEREERWGIDPVKIMEIAKRGFAHPRKLLSSNLKLAARLLEDVDIASKARAEDLSPDDWARLTRKIIK